MLKSIIITSSLLQYTLSVQLSSKAFLFNPAVDPETRKEFGLFVAQYHKSYKDTEEFNERLELFAKNKEKVDQHNQEKAEKLGYKMVMNEFADLTAEELEQY